MSSPYIKLKINLHNLKKIKISKKDFFFKANSLFINKNFNVVSKDFKTFQVILIGNPIIKNQDIFFDNFKNYSNNVKKIKSELEKINGQFLIFVNFFKINKIFIINDRYSSIPLYIYKKKNEVYFSYLYYDLNFIDKVKKLKFNNLNFLQVIFFNRMFGDATFHNDINFLLPATLFCISKNKYYKTRYWSPNFKHKIEKFTDNVGKKYISLLNKSIDRNLQDFKKNEVGIFLSGGHDSRSVLLTTKNIKPICFSVSFSNNYEVKVSKNVSKTLNLKNKFIKLEKDHFEKNFNTITRINSGFYSFIDSLFVGLNHKIPRNIKVLIHGHALDYMFQGMYIPFSWIKIFNRPTFFKKIKNLTNVDINDYFINNISYRVKGIDIFNYIKEEHKNKIKIYLSKTISDINLKSKKKYLDKFSSWEYLMMHTPSRHYSYPNVMSKLSLRQQRIVSFDNDLYDFYLSLNPKIRLEGLCMRYLMKSINKKVGKIETGNWGLPASDGPLIKTLKLILRKVARHITFNQNFKAPTAKDRTWPNRGEYIRRSKYFNILLNEMINSDKFKKLLYYFDWHKIDNLKKSLLMNKNNDGDSFFVVLLSLYYFLKKIKKI